MWGQNKGHCNRYGYKVKKAEMEGEVQGVKVWSHMGWSQTKGGIRR